MKQGPLQGDILALRYSCFSPQITEKDTLLGELCQDHRSYALSFTQDNYPRRFKALSGAAEGQFFVRRDEAGNPVAWVVRDSLGDTLFTGGGKFRDKNKFEILWELDKEGDTLWVKKRSFNEKGRWISEWEVDNRSRVQNRRRRVYLMGEEEVEEQELDRLGRPLSKAHLTFDRNGWLVEKKVLDKRGWMESKTTWKYNGRGLKLMERTVNAEEKQTRMLEFRYDGWGNLTEKRVYYTGNAPQKTFLYLYEYDEEGNWKRMDMYRGKILEEIRLREMIYR